MLDLCYSEDYKASVDFNVVMSDAGEFIELQATGEEKPFSRDAMNELLDLAIGGMSELAEAQRVAISSL
jgi:ribonuclease PH